MNEIWNQTIAGFTGRHLLQTWQWGQVKSRYGWQPVPMVWDAHGKFRVLISPEKELPILGEPFLAAALGLKRQVRIPYLPFDFNVLYIPKGPLLDWTNRALRQQVLDDVRTFSKREHLIFTKIDPDVCVFRGVPGESGWREDRSGIAARDDLERSGWRFSSEQVQFRNTILIDLSESEEEILGRMKQKTRYNIRLAERKGVIVRPGDLADLDTLFKMYAETSIRDGFVIRERGYYFDIWQTFIQESLAYPMIAEVDGQAVAGLFLFVFADRAWYIYGMSTQDHREKMPNYLLQWAAMQWAKKLGCKDYDLWGAPDEFSDADPMWGVYRFKEGLGGNVVGHIGAWDLPCQPWLYWLYTRFMPRILDMMRTRGKARTRRMMSV